jgi:outer membrane protein TolC
MHVNRGLASILIGALLAAGPAAVVVAQAESSTEPITVDRQQAVEYALDHNFGLRRDRSSLAFKKRQVETKLNRLYPQVSVSTSMARLNEKPSDPTAGLVELVAPLYEAQGIPFEPPDSDLPRWNLSARLNMQLTLSLQLFEGIEQVQLEYERGQVSLRRAKARVARDVKRQFLQVLLLQEQVKVVEASAEGARERYEQAQTSYESGLLSEYELLRSQVAYENTKPQLAELRNAVEGAKLALKLTMGMETERPIELGGSIETELREFEVDELRDRLADNPQLAELRAQRVSVRNLIDVTKTGMYPSVTFGFSADPTFQGDPWSDSWFEDPGDTWAQQSGAFSITLTQPLDPLLPGSQSRVTIEQRESELEQLDASLGETYAGLEVQLRNTVRELEQASTGIENKQLNVEVAERAYDLAEEAYNAGSAELLELKDAERELDRARFDLLGARHDYMTGLFELEYLLDTPVEELG